MQLFEIMSHSIGIVFENSLSEAYRFKTRKWSMPRQSSVVLLGVNLNSKTPHVSPTVAAKSVGAIILFVLDDIVQNVMNCPLTAALPSFFWESTTEKTNSKLTLCIMFYSNQA